MSPFSVIPNFNIFKYFQFHLFFRNEFVPINQFCFQGFKEVPLYKFFGRSWGVGVTSIPINWNIEKSGKQKIAVRMYPKYSETETPNQILGLNAGVKFSIEKEIDGEDETIFEFKTPFKNFEGKGNGGFLSSIFLSS